MCGAKIGDEKEAIDYCLGGNGGPASNNRTSELFCGDSAGTLAFSMMAICSLVPGTCPSNCRWACPYLKAR